MFDYVLFVHVVHNYLDSTANLSLYHRFILFL
uniref:Uncharacterized protein n=1 Tax=Arundo donax TaxID=35708 RepID=A0A0A8Y4H8_ARUDO